LQEKINQTLLTIDNLAENFIKSEDRTIKRLDQQMEMITIQLQEFAKQLRGGSRAEPMESEPTDSRKRSAKGKEKKHIENEHIP
jgi:ATP-dependent helicase/DNAse subunit B